jgi:hypothetical protein
LKDIAERKPGMAIGCVCHQKESKRVGKNVSLQMVPLSDLAGCVIVNDEVMSN